MERGVLSGGLFAPSVMSIKQNLYTTSYPVITTRGCSTACPCNPSPTRVASLTCLLLKHKTNVCSLGEISPFPLGFGGCFVGLF